MRRFLSNINIFHSVSIIFGLMIIMPLFNIFIRIFTPVNDTWRHIRDDLLLAYIQHTTILIFSVMLFASLIGTYSAYVITRYDFFGRKWLSWMLVLPLAIPSYVASYIYRDALSYTGTVSRFFRMFGFDHGISIMNMAGAVFIFVITLFPYVYLLVKSSLTHQSLSYEETAKLLGANRLRRLTTITLQLIRPALVAGVLLVVLETLNDYGVVSYLNIQVFSFAIFNAWFALGDVTSAIRLSALLMIFVFLIIIIEKALRGKKQYHIHVKTKPIQRKRLTGYKSLLVTGTLWGILGFGFIIPLLQLIWYFVNTVETSIDLRLFYASLNTIVNGIVAAVIVVIIALMLANFNRIKKSGFKQSWLKMTNLGYAVPGAVIAIAVNIFFIDIDRMLFPLYQWINPNSTRLVLSIGLFMLIFSYVLRFMAIGYNSIDTNYEKIGKQFTESAYVLNSSKLETLMRVDLPMLKPGIVTAFILVFIDVIKELPLTLILRPANYNSLATLIYQYASDEMIQESSASALILIVISSLLIYLITHYKKGTVNDVY